MRLPRIYIKRFGKQLLAKFSRAKENRRMPQTGMLLQLRRMERSSGTYPERCQVYAHFLCGEEESFIVQLLEEDILVIYLKEALKLPVFWHFKAEVSPKNLLYKLKH